MPAIILVIEDHHSVRSALRDWLAVEFPECRVYAAANSEDGLALFDSESPRLVVIDISLSQTGSIMAMRKMRAALPCARFVMLTVYDAETVRAQAAGLGADACVPRNTMRSDLIPMLSSLLVDSDD